MADEQKPRTRRIGPQSRGELMDHWKALAFNMRKHLEDMPHVLDELTTFETVFARIEQSVAEEQTLDARISDLVKLRQDDMQLARALRNQLAAQVQGKYGLTNEKLREFGLKPRKRRFRRKPTEEKPAPQPEPTPEPIKIT